MASIRAAGLTKNVGDLRAIEVPIAMVVLPRALPLRANRRANIIAAIVTIALSAAAR